MSQPEPCVPPSGAREDRGHFAGRPCKRRPRPSAPAGCDHRSATSRPRRSAICRRWRSSRKTSSIAPRFSWASAASRPKCSSRCISSWPIASETSAGARLANAPVRHRRRRRWRPSPRRAADGRSTTIRPFCCRCGSRPTTASDSGKRLQWLSRRWIYNIPRSLQTQGLRPLGRLALVDHCERVTTAHRTGDPGRRGSAKGWRLRPGRPACPSMPAPPRIFVIASISGGTGSGMVLDMGYLVRKTLADLGLSPEGVCGILAHCSGHNPQGRDLARGQYATRCWRNCVTTAIGNGLSGRLRLRPAGLRPRGSALCPCLRGTSGRRP